MVHRMYCRYWVTYGNNNRQYILQCKNPVRISFQDHHTLFKHNTNDSNEQAGEASTCTHISHAKYFMEWTSSSWYTCPQATAAGSEAWRLSSLKENAAPTQQQDFYEQTPIDEARDSVTLFWLL